MKRIYTLITYFALLALVVSAAPASAQSQATEGSIQAQSTTPNDLTFARFSLQDPHTSTAWWHSHTIVDKVGGVHLVFYDTTYIYYAHCAANCGDPANWLVLPVFNAGDLDSLDEPTLNLDANNRPRLMWYAEYSGETYYFYAECNANCTTNSANWSSVAVVGMGAYGYPENIRYFALDAQDRPHMVYPRTNYSEYGFYYVSCDSGCLNASNWYTTTVTTPDLQPYVLQLAFDSNSRPRVLGYADNANVLAYAECNSNCSTAANWGSVGLFSPITYLSEYGFALRVNAQGNPRIAYYDGNVNNNVLYYAWSNASHLTPGNWSSYTVNYPTNNDYWSLDLALDSQSRPAVALATSDLDMSYATCTANCETNNPTWQQQIVETTDNLQAEYPIPVAPNCVSATWSVSGLPSLSLDAANNPSMSYRVVHVQMCEDWQGHIQILRDAQTIRFATAGGAPQNNRRVYLPMVTR
jgi:hypothetical protein